MKTIPLTRGLVTLVDDEDYPELSKHKWAATKKRNYCYAMRMVWNHGNQYVVYMHRLVANAPKGMTVDHINRNALDNRRCNLRVCSPMQNSQNSRIQTGKSSAFKGVSWHKETRKWRTTIIVNKKQFYLGLFTSEREAAIIYNENALRYFGEFAHINPISEATNNANSNMR